MNREAPSNDVGLCLLVLAACSAPASERRTLNFNLDWKFIRADPPGASRTDQNDSQWTSVSAPHTFNDTEALNDRSPPGAR